MWLCYFILTVKPVKLFIFFKNKIRLAAACHLIEDWKGVVFVEVNADDEQVKTEPPYNAENATKLLNMGDLGISIWSFIRKESEKMQKEADAYKDEVVGKSQPSTTTPTNSRASRTTKKSKEKRSA